MDGRQVEKAALVLKEGDDISFYFDQCLKCCRLFKNIIIKFKHLCWVGYY